MTARRAPRSIHAALMRAAQPLGGVTNASLAIGRNQFVLAHASNPNKPDMLRLDDAIELDRLCLASGGGTPILDYFRAELESVAPPDVSWFEHMASMARESGTLMEALASALSDGQVSETQRQELLQEAFELKTVLDALTAQLGKGAGA